MAIIVVVTTVCFTDKTRAYCFHFIGVNKFSMLIRTKGQRANMSGNISPFEFCFEQRTYANRTAVGHQQSITRISASPVKCNLD